MQYFTDLSDAEKELFMQRATKAIEGGELFRLLWPSNLMNKMSFQYTQWCLHTNYKRRMCMISINRIINYIGSQQWFTLVSHKHNHTEDQWLEQVIYWANTVPSNSSSPLILTPFCYILGAEGQFWLINYIWLLKLKVKLCKAFQITVSVQCNSVLLLVPCSWSICCNTIYFKML